MRAVVVLWSIGGLALCAGYCRGVDGSTSHGDDEDEYERSIEDPHERSARGDESDDAAKAIETLKTLGATVWRAPPGAGAHYETVIVIPDFSDAALKQAVVHLRMLSDWHALSLNFSRVTDTGLVHLKELPQVQKLSLKVSKVTDAGLKRLAEMSWLREIDLTLCRVTDQGIAELKESLPDARITYSGTGDPRGETEKLRGNWRGKRILPGGKQETNGEHTLLIAGNDLSLGAEIGRFALKPDAKPSSIDIEITDGSPGLNTPWGRYLGIYRLEDDTLTLCLSPVYNGRRTRPTRFSPEAFYGWMYVFQRVKE